MKLTYQSAPFRFVLGLGVVVAVAAACSDNPEVPWVGGDSGGQSSVGGMGGAGGVGSVGGMGGMVTSSPDIVLDGVTVGSGGSVPIVSEVFGHSSNVLYRLDPRSETREVEVVGTFQDCGTASIIDLALDKDNQMFATSSQGLYQVDRETAKCTKTIATGSFPNSLSFVPKDTVLPNEEALVGYVGNDYIRIDVETGDKIEITADALTPGLSSSGDIVSVINGGTYLTVVGNGCGDCILQIDPSTGQIKNNFGDLGYSKVWGLSFWGGRAYGFNQEGSVFEIIFDNENSSVTTVPIAVENPPEGLSFYGAGSATSVPSDDIF